MPTSKLAKRGSKLFFLCLAATYLIGLGSLPIVGPDEPRYAEVAREMLLRRDWITPTLGGLPWFEKPPLLYWLMMASYRLFGVNEYAARLGPALCGLITAGFVWWIGSVAKLSREASMTKEADEPALGSWNGLVFLSSAGAIAFSRAASFDIVLTATVTGALACFFVWQVRTNESQRGAPVLLALLYLFIGLSLLAKGLVGIVIPVGVIATYLLITRQRPNRQLLSSLVWGLPLALLLAGIWYGPMIYRHGWTFIDQFFIQHHFTRFLSNKYHHPQPFYFYVPVILLMTLPWSVMLIASFVASRRLDWRGRSVTDRLRVFGIIWVLLPLLFFSFSKSKIPGYVLPALPAASLLIGERIACFIRAQRGEIVLRITAILLLIGVVAGAWWAVHALAVSSALVVVAACIVGVGSLLLLIAPQRRSIAFLTLTVVPCFVAMLAIGPAASHARRESTRDLMRAADARGYANAPVFYMLADDRTAEFYAGGRLGYQSNGEPFRFDGAQDLAAAIRVKGGTGLVLIETRWEKQLTDYAAVQVERIGSNSTLTLFIVRTR